MPECTSTACKRQTDASRAPHITPQPVAATHHQCWHFHPEAGAQPVYSTSDTVTDTYLLTVKTLHSIPQLTFGISIKCNTSINWKVLFIEECILRIAHIQIWNNIWNHGDTLYTDTCYSARLALLLSELNYYQRKTVILTQICLSQISHPYDFYREGAAWTFFTLQKYDKTISRINIKWFMLHKACTPISVCCTF